MRYFSAITAIVRKLKEELPVWLTYHDYDHVRDVYRMAREIGRKEGLSESELRLVLTAAILHDSGFILGNDHHEQKSVAIAREMLPQFGYSPEDLDVIEGLIMSTEIPHKPSNLAQMVICDADLDYLGRDDFRKRADQLFEELKFQGIVKTRRAWNEIQVRFLNQHRYFTQTSIASRQATKDAHLAAIMRELEEDQGE